ncbi:BCNT-domain-containing protein, partial [Westerdykella ornata]
YHESSDEDFNPAAAENAPSDDDDASTSDDNEEEAGKNNAAAVKKTQRGKKRKAAPFAEEEFASGDEVTIQAAAAARKRRKNAAKGKSKGKGKGEEADGDEDEDEDLLSFSEDDEGGEGGLIKTRAQRRVERKERRPLAGIEGATIDVDALWAQMSAAPLRPAPSYRDRDKENVGVAGDKMVGVVETAQVDGETELVSIRKVYTFAGQRTTEEKQVPRSSLQQYLSDGWKEAEPSAQEAAAVDGEPMDEDEAAQVAEDGPKVRRPLRRPSRYDPNPTGYVRALPPEHQLTWPRKAMATTTTPETHEPTPVAESVRATARPEKAQKLNVVDKSRLDWTGFVDKEGIAEELDAHGKTKGAYLGRMEFLASVEAKREEERRRLKAAAAS